MERVVAVEAAAPSADKRSVAGAGCTRSTSTRSAANVEYVLDFLAQVAERAPAAFERIQYIEQPTHRDLQRNPQNRMHAAAKIKPVVIDESLDRLGEPADWPRAWATRAWR